MYIILAGSGFISSRISIWYLAKPGSSLVTKKIKSGTSLFQTGSGTLFIWWSLFAM